MNPIQYPIFVPRTASINPFTATVYVRMPNTLAAPNLVESVAQSATAASACSCRRAGGERRYLLAQHAGIQRLCLR